MNRIPSREQVERLRQRYPAGTRIILHSMDDAQAPPPGTMGTVVYVDDMGQLGVEWDNGSALSLIPGEDSFSKVFAPEKEKQPVEMPDDEVLYELADLFRVFGDSTRIKILYALHDSELCVQDIADAVQLSQSAVSHQLRVLKDSKLVRFRREGKTVFYALDDDHVRSILSMGMDHIEE